MRRHLFTIANWISRNFFASRLSFAHIEALIYYSTFRRLWNLGLLAVEKTIKTETPRSIPPIAIIETTNICNLKCPFCLTGKGVSGGRERRHMNFDEARVILDDIAEAAYFLQLYTWGEPLLNKDTLKIIEYAKKKNLYVMLSTNGTAMTKEYSRQLIAAGLDYIMVAIDGITQETYETYRRGGNLNLVLKNLETLLTERGRNKRPFIEWQFIVFRHNEHEVKEAEAKAYAMGVNKFTPLPAYVEDPAWLPSDPTFQAEPFNPERLVNCSRPWTHLNVRADGGMAPCCYEFFKSDDFGNLREARFKDLWNNEKFRESRQLIKQFAQSGVTKESSLICHKCIHSGVRPSYIDLPPDDKGQKIQIIRKTTGAAD